MLLHCTYYPPDLMKFYVLSKCFKAIKSNVYKYLNAMRSIRMRLRTVGCPMNSTTDNSKLVPLKWFVFIIKYLAITCGRMISAPTVSNVVGSMKRWVSKELGVSIWQKSFFDRVIRGEKDYLEIWQYIDENPLKWVSDELYIG